MSGRRRHKASAGENMNESWNYYFEPCRAALCTGATVQIPAGHGIVTIDSDAASEAVFFPARQISYTLVPGFLALLERDGLATRYGKVRDESRY